MSARIEDLEPLTRKLCEAFLEDVRQAGLGVRVTHTLRTMDEQAHLYAQGRTLPGKKVTNAKPGESPHNYGMAFDVCFTGAMPYPPEQDVRWGQIGKIGEALGLNWGGPNGKGDKFTFDRPHFQRRDWKEARLGDLST